MPAVELNRIAPVHSMVHASISGASHRELALVQRTPVQVLVNSVALCRLHVARIRRV